MRLFVAIDLPKEIKDYVYELQGSLRNPKFAKLIFVSKKNLHLTLKFLGELREEQLELLKGKLKKIKFTSFKLHLTTFGFYPDKNVPEVLWIGIVPQEYFKLLQQQIDEETLDFGDLKLGCHLTFLRIKSLKDRKKFFAKLDAIQLKSFEFEVTSFSLYKSKLSKDGPTYLPLETYPF